MRSVRSAEAPGWSLDIYMEPALLKDPARIVYMEPDAAAALPALLKDPAREAELTAALARDPSAARVPDGTKKLPLHHAARRKCVHAVIQALLQAFPEAADTADDGGLLPLHWACSRRAPVATLQLLSAGTAINVPDDEGKLPIHHAVGAGASSDSIALLLSISETSASVCDRHGRLPIHYAASRRAPIEVVRALLSAFPAGARCADGGGGGGGGGTAGVLDLHYQSVKTAAAVLDAQLPDTLRAHAEVWLVTGTGHHTDRHSHQRHVAGGVLHAAVADYLSERGYRHYLAKDHSGQGGAFLVVPRA